MKIIVGKEGEFPKINKKFSKLFSDSMFDKRYYQVYGGRASGKSYAVSIAVVQYSFSSYGHKILYLRQIMSTASDSTMADVKNAITTLGLDEYFKEKGNTLINLVTGSTISFKGIQSSGNNTAKMKSLSGITILVIEEAEEVQSFDDFAKIDESIRTKGKPLKVIMIYNPTSSEESWIHDEWFVDGEPREDRMDDTEYLHTTYLDNLKNIAESTIASFEKRKKTDPTYYANVILAEWTLEAAGRIYGGWGEYERFTETGDVWYGLDFGYGGNDETSLIRINFVDDTYYINQVFSEKLEISETWQKMKEVGVPYNAKIYADSAVNNLIKEIRKNGFIKITRAAKGNVEIGIKRIQDKNIVLVGGKQNNPQLYRAYMTFKRKDNGKLPHEPDTLAALRYGINSHKPIVKKKDSVERVNAAQAIRRKGGFM